MWLLTEVSSMTYIHRAWRKRKSLKINCKWFPTGVKRMSKKVGGDTPTNYTITMDSFKVFTSFLKSLQWKNNLRFGQILFEMTSYVLSDSTKKGQWGHLFCTSTLQKGLHADHVLLGWQKEHCKDASEKASESFMRVKGRHFKSHPVEMLLVQ